MLHSRIQLFIKYLESIPPSYLSDASATSSSSLLLPGPEQTSIDYSILRSMQAMLNRLPLLIPADKVAFEREMLSEKNDVALISLLGGLNESVKEARDLGRKFAVSQPLVPKSKIPEPTTELDHREPEGTTRF
jgi:COP9 signalosome complex subunit 6